MAGAVGALLPEGAIVSDESITAYIHLPGATEGAPRHDWLERVRKRDRPGAAGGDRGGGRLP